MGAPEGTKKNEGSEARLAGWTNTEFWFNLPKAGVSGEPVLVKDGAALLPGDIYVSFLSDHVIGPQYDGGGMIFLGRGADHYLGTVEGADFSGWGSGFVPYGISLPPETSQNLLNGNYYGLLGHPAQVFLKDQKLPGFFPVAVTKEGVLLCYDSTAGDNPQEVIDNLIAQHRLIDQNQGEIAESFPHLARIMNRPPAEQSFAWMGEMVQEFGRWLKSTQGRLCQPSGLSVDLPANPLDLVGQVHLTSVTGLESPFPFLPAVVALPDGWTAVFYSGKNQANLEYVLDRTKDGSLQGSFKYGADFHLGEVAAPNGVSLAGDINFRLVTEGLFQPIRTLSELFSLLIQKPAGLMGKIDTSFEVLVKSPFQLSLTNPAMQLSAGKGTRDLIVRAHVEANEMAGQVVEGKIQIHQACWDFNERGVGSGKPLTALIHGCFTTDPEDPKYPVSVKELGGRAVQPGVTFKLLFDGYRVAFMEVELNGRALGLTAPMDTPKDPHQITFSGQVVGRLRWANTQRDPFKKPVFVLANGTELLLADGDLTIEEKNYHVPPQKGLMASVREVDGELKIVADPILKMAFATENHPDEQDFNVFLTGSLGVYDHQEHLVPWKRFRPYGQCILEPSQVPSFLASDVKKDPACPNGVIETSYLEFDPETMHLLTSVLLTVVELGLPKPLPTTNNSALYKGDPMRVKKWEPLMPSDPKANDKVGSFFNKVLTSDKPPEPEKTD